MFDLEKSINNWLLNFSKHRAFDHGSIHEMELHLRDHIEDLLGQGHSEKEAFEFAVKEFGEIPAMAQEEFSNQRRKATVGSVVRAAMLKSYYFIAIRNFIKHKNYFLINLSGLAIGMASFIFISLYIINELSFDRFHTNYGQTYRVSNEAIIRGEPNKQAPTSGPMAGTMLANYPEVSHATRLLRVGSVLVEKEGQKIIEEGMVYADSSFFSVFDFELLHGDPKSALTNPKSVVLSEDYAVKYFGKNIPVGQSMILEDSISYTVTGVVKNIPSNSHLQFDMIGSINSNSKWSSNVWVGTSQHTYVVLKGGTDIENLEKNMESIFYDYMAPEITYWTGLSMSEWEGAGNSVRFKLFPLKDIHLYSDYTDELEPTGNIQYVYIYGLIGIVILIIAIFNFVNLATAHSASRAKEVGVRKVIGSTRGNLISQFIFESIFVSLVATLIAVCIVILLTPSFNKLIGIELAIQVTSSYYLLISTFGLSILVGILAGFYPAFILSAFRPVEVLKGKFKSGAKAGLLRNLLVTIQFAASIVIIIGTLVIYNQLEYMLSKNLGFDKEQIVVMKRPDWLGDNLEVFKNDMLSSSVIKTVSNSQTIPGKGYKIRSYRKNDNPETFLFLNNQVSYSYKELMGLELITGRFFSKEFRSDSNAVVINESAAAAFGYDNPIGKTLNSAFKKGRPLTIIGVIKDYNFESLHQVIAPMSLELDQTINSGFISAKVAGSQDMRKTMAAIEDTWRAHSNDKPFEYFFFDEDYQNLYKSEATTGKILIVFSALSIFIACLGLIGLVAYTASIRKKEIGIRKVLGAGTGTLIKLLSSEIVKLVLIATLVSWPLAYLAMNYWLRNFSDRVDFSPLIYIGSTLAIIVIVGFAISFQTIKASLSNPVDSLRDE